MLALAAGFATVPAKFQLSSGINENSSIQSLKTADIEIGGKGKLKVETPGQQVGVSLALIQEEKSFSGTMSSLMGDGKVTNGTIKEKEFSAVIQANIQGQDMGIQMSGQLESEKMTGTLLVPNMDAIPFEGNKAE